MAITSDKLLNRPSEIHRRYSGRLAMQKSFQEKMVSGGPANIILSKKSIKNIGIIKTKVIQIESILKGTLAAEKKALDEKKREQSNKRREIQEEKLETKPKAETKKIMKTKIPKMGFLDWIKNFIGNIILGYFAIRLVDHLPKIIPILKFLGKATDFVLDVGGKLLGGLVTFIDWGYKAYDATKGFIKNLFGQDGVKQFEQLSSTLNQFLNLALVAGLASVSFGGSSKDKIKQRTKTGTPARVDRGRPKITKSGGGTIGKPDIRSPFRQRPIVTTGVGGTSKIRIPGTGPKITGTSTKGILSSVRPLLKRIPLPVVGALIDFGLSVVLGENPGRAAFRAIGAGLLGAVGAAAGSVVPVAGNFIGGLLGGAAGDAVGGVLYDAFFGGKSSTVKGKTLKKAGGGITRKGKPQGTVKRRVSASTSKKYRRKIEVVSKKPGDVEVTSPGSDVGGEEKLFNLFPDPFKMFKTSTEVMNPFGVIKDSAKTLGESDYFGPILSITSKILLGQKPSNEDYRNVGLGINLLVSQGINEGKLRGGLAAAFAEGGFVDPKTLNAISEGGDISNWVSKTFKESTETNAEKTLREIRNNLKLDKGVDGPDKTEPTRRIDEDYYPGGRTSGQWGPLLDLIAGKESGGNYEAMYPSTVLKGATKMTIAEVARRATGAVGKYQQLPQYLVSRAKAAGLNPEKDLYSPENQDLIITRVNIERNRGGRMWLNGEISDEQFMQGLSQEFASLPNAQGKFYYPGQRSSMSPDKIKTALSRVKKGGYSRREMLDKNEFDMRKVGKLGKGYGKDGMQIAGNLGFHMKKLGIVTGSIHRHPQHPQWSKSGHSPNSLHYQGRAIDLGGWAPSNPNSGGRDEQAPVIKSIIEWNRKNGYNPVELIHNSPKYKNVGSFREDHNDHVHVAYEKGGMTKPYPHIAMIGEKGREFVIDADSTAAIEGTFPGFLGAINKAKYDDAISVLRNFASYESESQEIIVIPMEDASDYESDYDSTDTGGIPMLLGGEDSDPFEFLVQGT